MKLKVTRKTHTRREEGVDKTYVEGDVFEGTENELKAFGDRLVVVEDEAPAKGKRNKGQE